MIPNNTLKNVYLNHIAAFLPNAPVGNDEMEAVLGMAGVFAAGIAAMKHAYNACL